MSPCVNACGSGLSWLDGNDECAACRPALPRECFSTLWPGRPPLERLPGVAAVQRETSFPPPVRAVEPLTPVPAGAETPGALVTAQGPTETREQMAAAMGVPVESVGYGPGGWFVLPLLDQPPGAGPRPVRFPTPRPRRSWLGRLLRRTA